MYVDGFACIIVLLYISPTFFCFHTKDGEKRNLCIKDRTLVIQTVMSNVDNASINCPDLKVNKENVNITLYKETKLHFTDFKKTVVAKTTKEKQRFSVHIMNNTIYYVIDMPQVNDTGLYNCTVAHGVTSKTTYAYLLVKDPSLQPCLEEGHSVFWIILAVGCGLLALYNIIPTIACCSFAWKLRHQDTYQNDYFNTRPGEFSRVK
ncbi:uncharacterized protein LOC113654513 [Tachysurus fulvidraco]|uniref:uncharacterized protein LOC113654513 n=1 Tax=Tachysurus fulvidraco TaxID=1234273 RepID=UPI000F4E2560|nr:uncharacterized protein LOC113654513 [Tachysurus fulvidraco]